MAKSEREFVRWLQRRNVSRDPDVLLGIGDDMAILRADQGTILVTSDMLLDGVHFDSAVHALRDIGRKAAACSLSDCAAMAVRPRGAVVSVALPRALSLEQAQTLADGIANMCETYDCAVIGGDTTSWPHPLAIDVAMLACPYENIVPVRRDGARAGDGVFVTGALGGSLLGRHLTFAPRVREAKAIAQAWGSNLHAMIDITDGVAIDLDRIAEASGIGAVLDERALEAVASEAASQASGQSGRPVLDHVLRDGEDFELLLVGPMDAATARSHGLSQIGEMVDQPGLTLKRSDGAVEPLDPRGYEHL